MTDGDDKPSGRVVDGDEPGAGNDGAGQRPRTDVDEASTHPVPAAETSTDGPSPSHPVTPRPTVAGPPSVAAGPSPAAAEPGEAGGSGPSPIVPTEAGASGPAVTPAPPLPGAEPAEKPEAPEPNPTRAPESPAPESPAPEPTASGPSTPGPSTPAPTAPVSSPAVPDAAPTAPPTRAAAAQAAVVPAVPAPTPTTGTRRRWPLWTVLGLALGLVAGAVPGVLLRQLAPDAAGQQTAGREAPGTAAERQLAARMVAQLDRQGSALLRGDQAGFLAVAEPTARPALTRRYAALRALRVTTWRPGTERVPVAVDGQPGQWRLTVTVGYCFVVPGCAPSTAELGTRWRMVGEEPRLVAVEPSRTDPTGVRPWEVDDLAVAVGERALVATTPAQRAKLPGLLARAEAAARAADRYAVGPPPDRYLVYYAGRAEWQRWYGGGRPKWTAGYAVGVGGGRHDVVLNAQSLAPAGVDDLLRHELTHAASLPDQGYADRADWWLVEGLAEYAGADGQPVDRYEGLAEVRKLLRGGWSGRLDAVAPADDATDDRVGGAYGVGYLAVRHLVDRYGEQRVLDFFRAVVHQRRAPDEAAEEVFGDPWPALHDDCVAYVRSAAG
ncbi:hypothetical protein [Micromonospora sp. RP3T]|uniref:hypothetical protein n=1 Tax=Micromonospora sp. RP3T TaxID=2135446 RepID=UPI001E5CD992|nr:hypothetical protein [Micromonospora sp. RP3T]